MPRTQNEILEYFNQPLFKNGYVFLTGYTISQAMLENHKENSSLDFKNALIEAIEFDLEQRRQGQQPADKEINIRKLYNE